MATPVVVSWSGGKDSAVTLETLRADPAWEVVRLLVTATRDHDRSSMHGVRMSLMRAQAEATGIPLDVAWIDAGAPNAAYEETMSAMLRGYRERGIRHVAFGDLHLEDVRAYREKMNAAAGMECLFPVWGIPPEEFARRVAASYRAVVTCVDTERLDASFSGRDYDEAFLRDLSPGVDPCGERGEFHTFCWDGPVFAAPVRFERGEQVLRDGRFMYTDLMGG